MTSPSRLLAVVGSVLVLSLASSARAQDDDWGLELSFDHGVSWASHPGSDTKLVSMHTGLDARLVSPLGLGAIARVGLFPGPYPLMAAELDLGVTYRAWVVRQGPRGLQLGGAIGLSAGAWSGNPQRPSVTGEECVFDASGACRDPRDERFGPFWTAQLDYREHSFLLGLAVLGRWLPGDLAHEDDRLGFAWLSLLLRVGGEFSL